MAIKEGHQFHAKHGFSGSAGKNHRITVPGFKRGGQVKGKEGSKSRGGENLDQYDGCD